MENYQVLARKYRPQNFSDVVGQETIVTTLKNALRFKKIAHAYLFAGSRGTGKTTLARLFAKALNCNQLKENQEPCNSCPSCKEVIHGQSLDVIEIDGASNRGIDDIREINEMVGYVPSHGKYKIYIIDEVHMLTKEAFNALLKTLEEPPSTAKFFFATTEPQKVLPTIISRCQRFDLGRIAPSSIIKKLEQIATDLSRTVDSEALLKIADLADGSLRDAESLFDQVLCFTEENVSAKDIQEIFGLVSDHHFFDLDHAFSQARLPFAFELIDHLYQSGKDLSHFMSQLIDHYRNIAIAKTMGESALPVPIASKYLQTAHCYTKQQSLYLLEYLILAQNNFQKSLSHRIFLESTLLHILRSKHRIPVEVIARRLSELQGKEFPTLKEIPPEPIQSGDTKQQKDLAEPFQAPSNSPSKLEEKSYKPEASPRSEGASPIKEQKVKNETPSKPLEIPSHSTDSSSSIEKNEDASKVQEASPLSIEKEETGINKEDGESEESNKHPSHYDTLMRFAAVELEGSLKTQSPV